MTNGVVPIARPGPAPVAFGDMSRLAEAIARSGLFGMKTPEQALALMAVAQAEGRHPALAARDYDIIQGRPAKKSEAMLRDFLESGGKVEWHVLTDQEAAATFSHPAGGSVRISWDEARAKQAGLFGKDMHRKYPRQMLRARVVSEGVRTVCPMATSGMYVPEEVADFEPKPMRDVTPPAAAPLPAPAVIAPPHDPDTGEIGPHAIAVPTRDGTGLPDWLQFGSRMIAAFKAATDGAELAKWQHLNAGHIAEMANAAPKAHGSVLKALEQCRERLLPAAASGAEPEMLAPDETDRVLA